MTRSEQARQALENNIVPLQVFYREVNVLPDMERAGCRTEMNVNSEVLGVLTPNEYRYVTARTVQSEELALRQMKKVLREIPEIPDVYHWISVPIPKRVVKSGKLVAMLSGLVREFPKAKTSRVCLEISADVLFENFENIAGDLNKARELGFLIGLSEVGNQFCPLLQATSFRFDYAFLDKDLAEYSGTEKADSITGSIVRFFNYFGTKVIAEGLKDSDQLSEADTMGIYGVCKTENDGIFPPFQMKEEDSDE